MRWKTGTELPPFVKTNSEVVQTLADLVAGTLEHVPSIGVSEAVAVMIWRLIFDRVARSDALRDVGHRGLYIILASLSHGARTEPADSNAVKRLQNRMSRDAKGQALGLAIAFRKHVKDRTNHEDLKGYDTADAARQHLLLALDSIQLDFDFGAGGRAANAADAGGGGGGPDDPGGAAEQANADAGSGAIFEFDIRTRTLEAQLLLISDDPSGRLLRTRGRD